MSMYVLYSLNADCKIALYKGQLIVLKINITNTKFYSKTFNYSLNNAFMENINK